MSNTLKQWMSRRSESKPACHAIEESHLAFVAGGMLPAIKPRSSESKSCQPDPTTPKTNNCTIIICG